MSRLKLITAIIVVVASAAAGTWAYWTFIEPMSIFEPLAVASAPELTPTSSPVRQPEQSPSMIAAEAKVVPAQIARLSFNTAGLVEEVFVKKNQTVEAGQVVARLGNDEKLAAAVSAAELERVSAQQALDDLNERARLVLAQAQKDEADARDAVRDAERTRDNMHTSAEQVDVDTAYANMILARDKLDKAREDYAPYENKPENNVTRAALLSRLSQAQKDYDNLESRYNNLIGTASEIDLAQADADLALAQARLEDAKRQVDKWKDGPDPAEVELAQSRLDNANSQLAAAQAAFNDLQLRAPFAGTIIVLDVEVGEYVVPGSPLVTLADTIHWQVETTDLAEQDVALLSEGMSGSLTLDAFPGEEFTGTVTDISYVGEDRRGDVTYTVTLDFDAGETPVRSGMTAYVDFPLP